MLPLGIGILVQHESAREVLMSHPCYDSTLLIITPADESPLLMTHPC